VTDLTRAKLETELFVIGAMLLDNRTIAGITEILDFDDFTSPDAATIFQTIVGHWENGTEATAGIVSAELTERLADIVWDAYQGIGSAVNAMWYAHKIKEAATRRELVARSRQIAKEAQSKKGDVNEIIGDAQTRMFEVQHKEKKTTIAEDFVELQRASEEAAKSEYGTVGVPTGFQTYDDLTGGLKKEDFIVLAARPSIGKTAAAVNIFQNIAERTDLKAMFFSGEMSRHQLLLRMASRRARIDNNALLRGNLSKASWAEYTKACGELSEIMEGRCWIDDRSRPSPGHVRALVKQKQQSVGVDVVFVDYLQIMSVTGKFTGRYEMLTEITGGMKAIAKDLRVPVVLLAQVSRAGEDRDVVRQPALTDLKGTGSIEEDADIVTFVHREDRMASRGKWIIAKHRNGPLGEIPVEYENCLTSFKEIV